MALPPKFGSRRLVQLGESVSVFLHAPELSKSQPLYAHPFAREEMSRFVVESFLASNISSIAAFNSVCAFAAADWKILLLADSIFGERTENISKERGTMSINQPTVRRVSKALAIFLFLSPLLGAAQQQGSPTQERIQQLQQAFADREKKPHEYQWIETTTATFDGHSRPPKQSMCEYGPDGKIHKTPLGTQGADSQQGALGGRMRGGLIRGMVMQKKKKDAKESAEQVRTLTEMYLPFDRDKLKTALTSGQVSVDQTSPNRDVVVIRNYAKKGDEVRLTLDPRTAQLDAVSVKTYFDKPKETLTASMQFTILDDGARYPSSTTVDAPSKKLSLSTTSSNFAKPAGQ